MDISGANINNYARIYLAGSDSSVPRCEGLNTDRLYVSTRQENTEEFLISQLQNPENKLFKSVFDGVAGRGSATNGSVIEPLAEVRNSDTLQGQYDASPYTDS